MAAEKYETPGGCRIDNGRCFTRLEFDEARATVFAIFRDGSEYEYYGLSADEARAWLDRLDPGCYFNGIIWPGDYRRTRPPD